MDYNALSTLIQTHPSWPGVTDADLVTWVNDEVITKTHETLSSGAVFAVIATNIAEFNALTDAEKQTVRDILYIHSGEGIPTANGSPARTVLQNIFSGTQTLTDLGAAVSYDVSRAANVGIPQTVNIYHIDEARRVAGG